MAESSAPKTGVGPWAVWRARRSVLGPLDYTRRWWMKLIVATTFLLLYAPILTLIAFSFNDSRRNIVWRGFTLKYYEKAWNNDSLIAAFANSLSIAIISTVISTILGVLAAIFLWRLLPVELAPQTDANEISIDLEMAQGMNIAVVPGSSSRPHTNRWACRLILMSCTTCGRSMSC